MSDLALDRNIFGYADRFSAAAGESLQFHVSVQNVAEYEAALVRLHHGFEAPPGPGFRETEIPSSLGGSRPGTFHACVAGSYVEVSDPDARLRSVTSLRLEVLVYPTLREAGRQGILGAWDAEAEAGYALFVERSCAGILIGDGVTTACLVLDAPLPAHAWTRLEAEFDATTGGLLIRQTPVGTGRSDLVLPAAVHRPEAEARGRTEIQQLRALRAPFRIAALSTELDGVWRATDVFNGKIEAPRVVAGGGDGAPLLAAWDFATTARPDGALLDHVQDTGPHRLHGTTVNAPTRAVTGHNWSGQVESFRLRPHEYGAIHFHSDDLDDARWPVAFTFLVPEDLPSGVYAARLRGGGAEEHVPFFVRPGRGRPRQRIAVLFATGSYLAYANDHLPFDADLLELLVSHTPVIHREDLLLQERYEFGRSAYEVHDDGSGVVFTSRRRPILTMRPKYRAWMMSEGPWQFPADLCIVDWLEAAGYSFDAITDEDLHREGYDLIKDYDVVLTGSHPEYVSYNELDAVEAYVSNGGRLMYLGGNGFYWLVSYHPEKPYLMEIRRGEGGTRPHQAPAGEQFHATSGERCGLWRNKGRPPQQLVGVGFAGQGFDRSVHYERLPDSFDPRAAFIFEGVGPDEPIGAFGIMGGGAAGAEVDRFDPSLGTPADALLLATSVGLSDAYLRCSEEVLEAWPGTGGSQDPDVRADMSYFVLTKGGAVFSVGSIAWTGALSHDGYDNNVAQITRNVLRRFLSDEPLDWTARSSQPTSFEARAQGAGPVE